MNKTTILQTLKSIIDPDFNKNIVDLGFVKNIVIKNDSEISLDIELTTPACPVKDEFHRQAVELLQALPGVTKVNVNMTAQPIKKQVYLENSLLHSVRHIVAVSSGKGGVGKSTVTANLAMALALSGARVGILDADIYGPSMGMMFGIDKDPEIRPDQTLVPVTVAAGIQIVSMSMLSDPNRATIWRGPMATQMINNFLHRVHWGHLDYLLIDFPPGTGDIQLTLTQSCPLSGAIVVTTPQNVALADVRKGLSMFKSVAVPVVGVIENMSWFQCDNCDKKHYIFRQGGGSRTAEELNLSFLGEIPIELGVADSGDEGKPIVYTQPNSLSAQCFIELAGKTASSLSVLAANSSQLDTMNLAFEELEVKELPGEAEKNAVPMAAPTEVFATANQKLAITWSDGLSHTYSQRDLRIKCPCAECIDEWTGEALLDPNTVSEDVKLSNLYTVGRYALGLAFSDGHRGGLYTWDHLRKIAKD